MFKKILVPLDGSNLSEAALPAAKAFAEKFNSEITLLRATSTPYILADHDAMSYAALMDDIRHQNLREVEEYLYGIKATLHEEGHDVEAHLIENPSAAAAILDFAKEHQFDIIVMSTHGRGGVARWIYGSVAEKVLRHSPIPIMLIRAKEAVMDWKPINKSESYTHTVGAF